MNALVITPKEAQRALVIASRTNAITPAEADVVKTEIAGATHNVLNNSDASLSFTAPSGKSFSKWNTKADGSGTDKAAASTITMTADVVLYAVWA